MTRIQVVSKGIDKSQIVNAGCCPGGKGMGIK